MINHNQILYPAIFFVILDNPVQVNHTIFKILFQNNLFIAQLCIFHLKLQVRISDSILNCYINKKLSKIIKQVNNCFAQNHFFFQIYVFPINHQSELARLYTNFENDIAEQISFGQDGTGIISQIIRAVKRIHSINKKPQKFWFKYLLANIGFISAQIFTFFSNWDASIGMLALTGIIASHFYYLMFFQPFLIQSLRKTIPLIIMDDLNKIQHLNMLSQVVRFLKLIQQNAGNIMLVSSDQQTWAQLRKQPGMKDRLRVRQIKYNHKQTAKKLLDIVQNNFQDLIKQVGGHSIYDKDLLKPLTKQLVGVRQMTLRRFISVLKLNDQQEYEKLLQILKSRTQKPLNSVISEFTKILFQTQTQTMVANLKMIKRQFKTMSQPQFIQNLKLLLNKFKLPSDNKIASHLKLFNIVRDLRSQYVVNGRFIYIIYQMAVQQYEIDYKQYYEIKNQIKIQGKKQTTNQTKIQNVPKQSQKIQT